MDTRNLAEKLKVSIDNNQVEAVKTILLSGEVNINDKIIIVNSSLNSSKKTALEYCIKLEGKKGKSYFAPSYIAMIKTIVKCGAKLDKINFEKLYIDYKADDLIIMLLRLGANPNLLVPGQHNHLIFYSARAESQILLEEILKNGGNPNVTDKERYNRPESVTTPLFNATLFGLVNNVKLLLQYGADPLFLNTDKKITAYQEACNNKHRGDNYKEICDLLYNAMQEKQKSKLLKSEAEEKLNLEELSAALFRSLNEKNQPRALQILANLQRMQDYEMKLVSLGIRPPYSVKKIIDTAFEDNETALFIAARNGLAGALHQLLLLGADITVRKNSDHSTVLMEVISSANCKAEQKLNCFEELIAHGADIHAIDKINQAAALHYSVASPDTLIIANKLLELKVSPNVCDTLGRSPLIVAVICNNAQAVKLLLQYGADQQLKTSAGMTPWDLAKELGFVSIMNLLTPPRQYDSLKNLVETIKKSDCDISEYIKQGVLTQDKTGDALYHALSNRHEMQIKQLLQANVKVDERHYYAAGLSHKLNSESSKIYALLPPDTIDLSTSIGMPLELILLITEIKKDQPDWKVVADLITADCIKNDKNGSCLYFAILNKKNDIINKILENGAVVKNKHFYAAGMVGDNIIFEILKDYIAPTSPSFNSNYPHKILGVSQLASQSELKQAYKKLMLYNHPDKNVSGLENAKKINLAYDVLKAKFN